jgi:hypothetical protein
MGDKKQMRKLIKDLRALIADCFLSAAFMLYPHGDEKLSLALNLHAHFKTVLDKESFIDEEKEKQARDILIRDGILEKESHEQT